MPGGRRGRARRAGLPVGGPREARLPFVAIVGRPNAGKSTLFNRLARAPLAIVDPLPGVTRDRIYAEIDLRGRPIGLIDTGGVEAEATSADVMADRIRLQVRVAVEEADVVLCVFDGASPPTADDERVVDMLRRAQRPVVWAVNKIDRPDDEPAAAEYYALGVAELFPLSAATGRGMGPFVDAVAARLPERPAPEAPEAAAGAEVDESAPEQAAGDEAAPDEPPVPRVAVIGRPNVGKSTLVNRLLGEERMLVDERPGTTRDAVDTLIDTGAGPLVLIDTAGLRRRSRIADRLERLAALSAVRALERCHVAVLLVDASTDAGSDQDRHLLGLAAQRGRALIVAVNKIDLVPGAAAQRALERRVREAFSFAAYAPVLSVSARSGRGVDELTRTITRLHASFNRRARTGELNRFLEAAAAKHSPPLWRNRPVRLLYAVQTGVRPPSFVLFTNHPQGVHRSYEKYLEKQLRERLGFEGCPLRLRFRRGRDEGP